MKKFLLLPVFCFVLIFALNIHTADNAVNTINSNTVETKEKIFNPHLSSTSRNLKFKLKFAQNEVEFMHIYCFAAEKQCILWHKSGKKTFFAISLAMNFG